MANYWLANFYRGEDHGIPRLTFGFANNLWLCQHQWHHDNNMSVWQTFPLVHAGDKLIARLTGPARIFAIGTVVPPRLDPDHRDTVERTRAARNHQHVAGVVGYDDAPMFYEDLRHLPPFDGDDAWGQRIDVDRWRCIDLEGRDPPGGAPRGAQAFLSLSSVSATFYLECVRRLCGEEAFLRKRAELDREERRMLNGSILNLSRQVILHGPPGTGKTWQAKRMAAEVLGIAPGDERALAAHRMTPGTTPAHGVWDIVQFHPSYNYEDFVRGLVGRPEAGGIVYRAEDRIFGAMCRAAEASRDRKEGSDGKGHPHVLVIDEINRANIASVFGELLFALEYRSRRDGDGRTNTVSTLHAVDGDATLAVPENLYIIGTMNTADRSIGHLDYAFRRRFAFIECSPDRSVIEEAYPSESEVQMLALELFDQVGTLFAADGGALSPEYRATDVQVGHTYFLGVPDEATLRLKLRIQVVPLLREYIADGVLRPEAATAVEALASATR